MKRIVASVLLGLFVCSLPSISSTVYAQTKKGKTLIYGPKSQAKIKELFFDKDFKTPAKVGDFNALATYTSFNFIEGVGNVYNWDFNNGLQISLMTENKTGKPNSSDKASIVNFNLASIGKVELGQDLVLNQTTLADIQKKYADKLKKTEYRDDAYQLDNGKVLTNFYFTKDKILYSVSISDYSLDISKTNK